MRGGHPAGSLGTSERFVSCCAGPETSPVPSLFLVPLPASRQARRALLAGRGLIKPSEQFLGIPMRTASEAQRPNASRAALLDKAGLGGHSTPTNRQHASAPSRFEMAADGGAGLRMPAARLALSMSTMPTMRASVIIGRATWQEIGSDYQDGMPLRWLKMDGWMDSKMGGMNWPKWPVRWRSVPF